MPDRDISDVKEPPPGPPADEQDTPFEDELANPLAGPIVPPVEIDWLKAILLQVRSLTHAIRSLDSFSESAELQRTWWESSIEAEYEGMQAVGEAKKEGHSEE